MSDMRTLHSVTRRCGWGGLGGLAAGAVIGCSSMGQDLSALGESIMPVNPDKAVRLMVDPHDPDNRRRGTVLIANSPFGGADAYLAMYRDRVENERDPLVKAASIGALGRYGGPEDAPRIAGALGDEQELQVRWEAAKALQRIHNPTVVSPLLQTLGDEGEQPDIRVATAVALGQYPQDRVFQGLIGALDAVELSVNLAAQQSLVMLTGEDFRLDPRAWLRWYNAVEQPFARQQEYLYPTYQRRQTWLEKLAFWSTTTFEQPGPPAGLRPVSRRKTYPDSDEAPADETGG